MNKNQYTQALNYLQLLENSYNALSDETLHTIIKFCGELGLLHYNVTPALELLKQNLILFCSTFIMNTVGECQTYAEMDQITDDLGLLIDFGLNEEITSAITTLVESQDSLIIRRHTKLIYEMTFAARQEYLETDDNYNDLIDLAKKVQRYVSAHEADIKLNEETLDYISRYKELKNKLLKSKDTYKRTHSKSIELCDRYQKRIFADLEQTIASVISDPNQNSDMKNAALTQNLHKYYAALSNPKRIDYPVVYLAHVLKCFDRIIVEMLNLNNLCALKLQDRNFLFISEVRIAPGLTYLLDDENDLQMYPIVNKMLKVIFTTNNILKQPRVRDVPQYDRIEAIVNLHDVYVQMMFVFNSKIQKFCLLQEQLKVQQLIAAQKFIHDLMLFYSYTLIRADGSPYLTQKINALFSFIELSNEKISKRIFKTIATQSALWTDNSSIKELEQEIQNLKYKIDLTLKPQFEEKGSVSVRKAQVKQHQQHFANADDILIDGTSAKQKNLFFSYFTKMLAYTNELHEQYTTVAAKEIGNFNLGNKFSH